MQVNPNLAPSSSVLRSGSNASTFQAGQAWEIIFNQPLVSCDRPSHHCDLGHQHLDALVILWANDKPKKKMIRWDTFLCLCSQECICLALLLWSGVSWERMIYCFHLPSLLLIYVILAVEVCVWCWVRGLQTIPPTCIHVCRTGVRVWRWDTFPPLLVLSRTSCNYFCGQVLHCLCCQEGLPLRMPTQLNHCFSWSSKSISQCTTIWCLVWFSQTIPTTCIRVHYQIFAYTTLDINYPWAFNCTVDKGVTRPKTICTDTWKIDCWHM
jgi:hypothetical protein